MTDSDFRKRMAGFRHRAGRDMPIEQRIAALEEAVALCEQTPDEMDETKPEIDGFLGALFGLCDERGEPDRARTVLVRQIAWRERRADDLEARRGPRQEVNGRALHAAHAWLRLAAFERGRGRGAEAAAAYRAAIERMADHAERDRQCATLAEEIAGGADGDAAGELVAFLVAASAERWMRRDTVEQIGNLAYARGDRAGAAAAYERLIASYPQPPEEHEIGVHRAVVRLVAHHAASGDDDALRALGAKVVAAHRALATSFDGRAVLDDPWVQAGLAVFAERVPAARAVLAPEAPKRKKAPPKPDAAQKQEAPTPTAEPPPEEPLPEVEAPDQFAHLELVEGSASRFWRVVRRGGEVRTTFGRIGTRGQTKLETFDDSDDADEHVRAMIDEKTGKGYQEIELSELARRALVRPAWTPVLAPGDAELAGSTIGGAPWIEAGATWPACDDCGRPLGFIVQLSSAECPLDLGGGLIQLFLCGWCGPEAYALVRVRPKKASADPAVREAGALGAGSLTPRAPMRITGWDGPEDDLPYGGDEDAERALAADPDLRAAVDAEGAADELDTTAQGDKLGGWPYWHESVGVLPRCVTCGARHRLLVQLDFGRSRALPAFVGIAFVGNCAVHPEALSLTWTT